MAKKLTLADALYGEIPPNDIQLTGPQELKTYEDIPLVDELIIRLHDIIDPNSLFIKNYWRMKLADIKKFPRNIRGVIRGMTDFTYSITKDLQNPQKIQQAQAILNMFDTYEAQHMEKPSTTIIHKTGIPPRSYY